MAVNPPPMDIEYAIELHPAWKDALLEDEDLQEKAAERLAAYINEGRSWLGRTGPEAKMTAEVIKVAPGTSRITYGLLLKIQLRLEVRAS